MAVAHNGLMPAVLKGVINAEQADAAELWERAHVAVRRIQAAADKAERRADAKGVCPRCRVRRAFNRSCFC